MFYRYFLRWLLILVTFWTAALPAQAKWQEDIIRYSAKVPREVPLKNTDQLNELVKNSPLLRAATERELKAAGKLLPEADNVVRSNAVRESLARILGENPTLLRQIDRLDDMDRASALVMARGSQDLTEVIGDMATRARLIEVGGPELIAAVGLYGPDMAKISLALDTAMRAGKLVSPTPAQWSDLAQVTGKLPKHGMGSFRLEEFTALMVKGGEGTKQFFVNYVQPHWKLWATGSAILAYSLNPEFFQDQTGRLTEAGFRNLVVLMGEVAASSIRGTSQGMQQFTEQTGEALNEAFFRPNAWIGVSLILLGILLAFRRTRYYLLKPFRWLNTAPNSSNTDSRP